jgi:peroxiredoxin
MRRRPTGLLFVVLLLTSVASSAFCDREDIHASAELVQPLLAGMKAPDFSVRDVEGSGIEFGADAMDRPVVITFFRGGWCPYCNLHLAELRKAEKQLAEMGFDIWFISIDRPELLLDSLDNPETGYTVYSDADLDATRAFGLAFKVDEATITRYLGHDIDLKEISGRDHEVLPAPATYIIGSDGIINFAYINPNYKLRLHPDVLLAAARTYRNDEDARLIRLRKKTLEN